MHLIRIKCFILIEQISKRSVFSYFTKKIRTVFRIIEIGLLALLFSFSLVGCAQYNFFMRDLIINTLGINNYKYSSADDIIDLKLIKQEKRDNCAAACIQMILSYYGDNVTQQSVATAVNLKNGGASTTKIKSYIEGLNTYYYFQFVGDVNDIEDNLKAYRPLMILYLYRSLFIESYHFMVLIGEDSTKKYYIFADPQKGLKKINKDIFYKNWRQSNNTLFLLTKK